MTASDRTDTQPVGGTLAHRGGELAQVRGVQHPARRRTRGASPVLPFPRRRQWSHNDEGSSWAIVQVKCVKSLTIVTSAIELCTGGGVGLAHRAVVGRWGRR